MQVILFAPDYTALIRFESISANAVFWIVSELAILRRRVRSAAYLSRRKRKFLCVACGFSAHADWVGAVNIREAGLASLALLVIFR
jgi:hypothetical protein